MVRDTSTLPIDYSSDLADLVSHLIQISTTSYDAATLLAELAAALGAGLGADGCAIVVSTLPSERLKVVCWLADGEIVPVVPLWERYESLVRRLHSSKPLLIQDVEACRVDAVMEEVGMPCLAVWQGLSWPDAAPAIGTILEMPMCLQGRVSGVVSLMRSQPYSWTGTEVKKLELVTQQCAALLFQACLQQQVAQQNLYQQVVNQLTMAIRNASELGEILNLATEDTAKALQAQRGLLLRLKYQDFPFRHQNTKELPKALPKARVMVACEWRAPTCQFATEVTLEAASANQSFWLSDCDLCQKSFRDLTPIVIKNRHYFASEVVAAQISSVFTTVSFSSLLIVPLESQGTILGFLVFQDPQPHCWQKADIEFVELVSAQVSTAILQTETLRQVQALVEKRTAELQQSLTIQAKLYERTRQQLDQLRHLNQLKDEFLDTVSHELRTPLTSMALAIRMLRQVGLDSDRSHRYLDILEQQCAQETNLVNDLLALQELESQRNTIHPEEISLVDLIEDLAKSFCQRWRDRGLRFELEAASTTLTVQSDRDSLTRILLELLTNAEKYSASDSCIQLTLTQRRSETEETGSQIIISLSNQGLGIGSDELPYIFDKFRRCEGVTQNAIQGTGLGLALVKSLVQHLSGTISVSSVPLYGSDHWETCFTLILPQSLNLLQTNP